LGNISFSDLSGKFSANTSLGNITFDSLCLAEGSSFRTQLGNIKANTVVLDGSAEVSTDQGNISINSDSLILKDGVIQSIVDPIFELHTYTGLGNIRLNNTKI
jgi:hypothetical protein